MRNFDSIPMTTEDVEKADHIQSLYDTSDQELLFLRPSQNNGGIEQSQELMKVAFFTEDEQKDFFKRYNISDVCGFEIWYQDGDIEFYWYVPNDDADLRYRRFLNSAYQKGEIGSTMDKFVEVRDDDYMTGAQYYLKNHYFEPVKNHRQKDFTNIYKNLLSEINTKDDTRVVMQVLFKPAEDDWCDLYSTSVEDVANAMDADKQVETKLFGLIKNERELSSAEKKIPKLIKQQRDENGYYVNFRVCVLGSDQHRIEQEMSEIDNIIKLTFESPSGQNFVPKRDGKRELNKLLEDMMLRRPDHMNQPKRPRDYLEYRLSDVYKNIIMTATELASIAHIPNSKEVDISGIRWSVIEIDGSLPTGSVNFEMPDETEQQETVEELQKSSLSDDEWDEYLDEESVNELEDTDE